MAYERLADFVQNLVKMPHIYQPVMLITLLLKASDDLVRGPSEGG